MVRPCCRHFAEQIVVADVAGTADDRGVARLAGADGFRHRSERHGEGADAAVGFRHHHGEIAGVVGGVQIVDGERPRRDGGFIQRAFALQHRHARVAFRHAAYHRRIAALRIRQHAVVRTELNAAKARAGEEVPVGKAFAQQHFAARGKIARCT